MKFSLFLLTLLVPYSLLAQKTEPRILMIGDSLTAGYGVAKNQAFPQLVQDRFKKDGKAVTVINAGTSGSTSASAVGRLKWHLKKKPDIMLLALGANDGLRGTPVAATRKNLNQVITLAKKNNIKVVLAGMKLPMNYGQEYRSSFEKVFQGLVKEHKLVFIPFLLEGVGGQPELNLADGIHPNEKGHQKISETVYKYLKGLL